MRRPGSVLVCTLVILAVLSVVGSVGAQAKCDADRDGQNSVACGGADCDDNDAYRYRGNPERCEGSLPDGRAAATHDEDCDPCTVTGQRPDGDRDFDLIPSSACSNPWPANMPASAQPVGCDLNLVRIDTGARRTLGADCDDTKRAIVPGSQVCDSNPVLMRVCLDKGVVGPDKSASDWDVRKCAGHCVPQPNGTGICVN